ncbi:MULTISPECIES: hypothetical protein [unclassified Hoeflea]|uniref:hypothetical protein n=1 Tax=unclassified Hoeflea TaxID=2614931 RepID=UPI00398FD5AB
MTKILSFDQSRCRRVSVTQPPGKAAKRSGQVLFFTGVRREFIEAASELYVPVPYEPMFEDPAPCKRRGKKPKRGKHA